MRRFVVLAAPVALIAAAVLACDNRGGLNGDAHASPSATPSVAVTVTPPPCPVSTVVPGPPPNVTSTSNIGCGNANKAVLIADPLDNDGNTYLCVWLCTTEPGNSAPHESLQVWDLSNDDGDGNTLVSTQPLACCTVQP